MTTEVLNKLVELGSRDVTLFVLGEYQCRNGHVAALLVDLINDVVFLNLYNVFPLLGQGADISRSLPECYLLRGEIGIDIKIQQRGK